MKERKQLILKSDLTQEEIINREITESIEYKQLVDKILKIGNIKGLSINFNYSETPKYRQEWVKDKKGHCYTREIVDNNISNPELRRKKHLAKAINKQGNVEVYEDK